MLYLAREISAVKAGIDRISKTQTIALIMECGFLPRKDMMIRVSGLTCGYGDKDVISGLNLALGEGEFVVLAGPNGAGKSTLLYALLGFVKARQGTIELYGKPLSAYRRQDLARLIAFIPQESVFQFDYSVLDIVLMGRYPYLGIMQSWTAKDRDIATAVLARLGLESFAERFFSELSGGEKQRVLIARALAQETKYIFLDESLSQLDINHQIETMELLRHINRQSGTGIILISHNLNLAANFAGKLVFLRGGQVIGSGTATEMMRPEVLGQLFGMPLQTAPNPISGVPNLIYPGFSV